MYALANRAQIQMNYIILLALSVFLSLFFSLQIKCDVLNVDTVYFIFHGVYIALQCFCARCELYSLHSENIFLIVSFAGKRRSIRAFECAKRSFIITKSEKEKLRKNNGYMSCLIHLMIIICTAINIIVVIY